MTFLSIPELIIWMKFFILYLRELFKEWKHFKKIFLTIKNPHEITKMKLNFISINREMKIFLLIAILIVTFYDLESPFQLDLPAAPYPIHQNEFFDHKIFSHFHARIKVANDKHTREDCQINLWIILRLLERQFFGLNFHVYFPQNCHFYLDTETWDNEGVLWMVINGSRVKYRSWRDKTLLNIFDNSFSNVSIKFFNFLIKSSD
jgi:hypothetical protein